MIWAMPEGDTQLGRARGRRRGLQFRMTGQPRDFRWVLTPLLIFGITRLIGAIFLSIGAQNQVALLESSPAYDVRVPEQGSPGYWGVVSNWDGQWYRSIAESGYPASLPREGGEIVRNEWAFYPAFPMMVRALMLTTDWQFELAATTVSLICSGLAVILLYRMLLVSGDRLLAFGTVLCLCTYPAAPILQVAYSEGLALLLIVGALFLLRRRRYGWLAVVIAVLSLTRAVVLPLALVLAVQWVLRWRRTRTEPFPQTERLALGAVALFAAASAGFWPTVAAIATGEPRAFTMTQAAWSANQGAQGLWGNWLVAAAYGATEVALLSAIALGLVLYSATRPGARRWGTELRAWSIAYPIYLLVATRPTPSALRYFMLAIGPLWLLPETDEQAEPRSTPDFDGYSYCCWPCLASSVSTSGSRASSRLIRARLSSHTLRRHPFSCKGTTPSGLAYVFCEAM